MKAITIQQPYASLIMHGLKVFETRSWATPHRGPLLTHAARNFSNDNVELAHHADIAWHLAEYGYRNFMELPRGVILGEVELLDIFPVAALFNDADLHRTFGELLTPTELQAGHWINGHYAWLLRRTQQFQESVPARGQQGLWDFVLEHAPSP